MAAQEPTTQPPLSPGRIEKLPPGDHRDTAAPGLFLRVTPRGARVFRWYVRSIGRAVTIGRWSKAERPGHVTLADARKWLERLKEAHHAGRLDQVEAELAAQLRPPPPPPAADVGGPTFRQVADDFLAHIERRRKRPEQVRRTFQNDLLPALGDRPIAGVTPRDIRKVVEAVVARGAPTQAGRVLAHAKQLFRFACGRDELAVAANPAFPLEAAALGVENRVCQRFLTVEEIPAFWRALDASRLTSTVRIGLKVLLLTGVRTQELIRARWAEVDLGEATWTIPVANQKLTRKQEQTARPWVVPLPPMVVELFKKLQVLADGSPWVMATPPGFGDPDGEPAHVTEKALGGGMRKLFVGDEPLLTLDGERPTPHDLRRTLRTHLEETLGVDENVAERCLNHTRGTVVRTYAVADLVDKRRAALERWAAYVEQLVAGSPANVVAMSAGARG